MKCLISSGVCIYRILGTKKNNQPSLSYGDDDCMDDTISYIGAP